jgi:hypothetical protein
LVVVVVMAGLKEKDNLEDQQSRQAKPKGGQLSGAGIHDSDWPPVQLWQSGRNQASTTQNCPQLSPGPDG